MSEDERAVRAAILTRFEGREGRDTAYVVAELAHKYEVLRLRFDAQCQDLDDTRAQLSEALTERDFARDEVIRLRAAIMGLAGRADDLFRSGCETVEESEQRL